MQVIWGHLGRSANKFCIFFVFLNFIYIYIYIGIYIYIPIDSCRMWLSSGHIFIVFGFSSREISGFSGC